MTTIDLSTRPSRRSPARDLVALPDVGRRREIERADEDPQPVEQRTLTVVQQAVAPFDRARAESGDDLDRRDAWPRAGPARVPASRGSGRDSVCESVQPQVRSRAGCLRVARRCSPTCGSSSSNTPPPAAAARSTKSVRAADPGVVSSGPTTWTCSPYSPSASAACGKHAQSRASHQDSVDDFGGRVENVLAVVEHDETLTVRQPCGQLIERRLIRFDVDEARGGDRGSEIDATVDGCQIDEERPTGPARLLAAGDLDGQAVSCPRRRARSASPTETHPGPRLDRPARSRVQRTKSSAPASCPRTRRSSAAAGSPAATRDARAGTPASVVPDHEDDAHPTRSAQPLHGNASRTNTSTDSETNT